MKQWKTLIAATLTAVFAGAVLTGCGGSAELGPTPPKEAVAQLKFNGKDVPLYEYKGAELPKLQGYDTSLALTKDAIYAISIDGEKKYHLQKIQLKDGAITAVEDLGSALRAPVTSDGTNIYYIPEKGKLGIYDGKAAPSVDVTNVHTFRAVFGGKNGYMSQNFVSDSDVLSGTLSKEGLKDPKTVLSKDVYKARYEAKDETYETNPYFIWADADGFYISSLASHDSDHKKWTEPFHMYSPDGKLLRTFKINEGIPSDAEKLDGSERQAIATKDYVVFYTTGCLRVFNKKDGAYVGDVELKIDKHSLMPEGVAADEANRIYFIDDKTHIYRIDL